MKRSWWWRLRRRWVMGRYGLDEAAADDFLAGVDLGDHDVAVPKRTAAEEDDYWATARKALDG
ncbi:MAG TPA: hypothetical protein VMY69_07220 [Phycisphaerae bacterium]|nr:hypothetical protein [Phycisphaerae bacterium]